MRYSVKRQEQTLPENLRHQRTGRSRGHVAKDGGLEERNGDKGEGGVGQHGLDGKASGLESQQGGEIKTRGGELKVDGVEDGLRRKAWN